MLEVRCYSDLQVHIVESKWELTRKDPIKRKVTLGELEKLAHSAGGLLFSYVRDQEVESILQKVLTYERSS